MLVLTQVLSFSRLGDIIEVQLPPPALTHHQQTHPTGNGALLFVFLSQNINLNDICAEPKHRGFAFITFGSSADAQDAIDNMDMNELKGRVLKVNLARPMKGALQPNGNRASKFLFVFIFYMRCIQMLIMVPIFLFTISVWESEEWLKEHVKPLAQSGGLSNLYLMVSISSLPCRRSRTVNSD